MALNRNFLRGSYPPLVTPFRDGAVDYDAYARLVERQVAEGSHGVVVNGTTAEPSTSERRGAQRAGAARGADRARPRPGGRGYRLAIACRHDRADRGGGKSRRRRGPDRDARTSSGRRSAAWSNTMSISGERTRSADAHLPHTRTRGSQCRGRHHRAHCRADRRNLVGMKHAANDLALVTQVLARLGNEFPHLRRVGRVESFR